VGKFDQLKRPESNAPLATAMTAFVKLVFERGDNAVVKTNEAILKAVEDDIGLFPVMIS
jgi:hypothetical protein